MILFLEHYKKHDHLGSGDTNIVKGGVMLDEYKPEHVFYSSAVTGQRY